MLCLAAEIQIIVLIIMIICINQKLISKIEFLIIVLIKEHPIIKITTIIIQNQLIVNHMVMNKDFSNKNFQLTDNSIKMTIFI
jgi:hypothetical protein